MVAPIIWLRCIHDIENHKQTCSSSEEKILHQFIPVQYAIVSRNTKISSFILLSFYINTYLNNMILSEETLRYSAACYCPSTLIHTVQHHIFIGNTKISGIILLYFYINTYLYNMIFSEETLRYPTACYCPSILIHTWTIWYFQKKHWDIQQYVIVPLH